MTSLPSTLRHVAIVGGGAAGTLAAIILSKLPGIGRLTLLDRDGRFGRGLAYSAPEKWHRINVPAIKMGGVDAEDSEAFVDWLAARGDVTGPEYSDSFVPRWTYGDFLCDQLAKIDATGRLEQRTATAVAVARSGDRYRIELASGDAIESDMAVLCIGNQPPSPFPGIEPSARSIDNVWTSGALDAIAPDDRVLVIGTGATAVDIVIDLMHRGIRKEVTMLSRRGLLPRVDVATVADPDPVEIWPIRTVRGLLHSLREDIRRKQAAGLPWQTSIDTFRLQTAGFWQGLSTGEQARFSRHLRAYWLSHRHRLAPDVATSLEQWQSDGRLSVVAGNIVSAVATPTGHDARLRRRGGSEQHLATNWILNCTGPEERYDRIGDPLIGSLLAGGQARRGALGLGLDVDPNCRLRDAAGYAHQGLYAVGPATRGAFWEVTAASNIRKQLLGVADYLRSTNQIS
ncbi:FAD/NAD(P)-binding protein [Tardiphaga sp.]|uniref:FAD/NAD(P)-binding protein n=1 Tax=Tardiphaga sp. TaxID=1926292 RepID=UPI00260DEA05|nr:FAD/NAD(P)-binding protein [Tardiphaga sp.]MDB5619407.1 putative NAD(P)/FAD-binding protein YdhS [Tardiphaga sp.]